MLFNYVDIGTSDFETSLDIRKKKDKVLLVEPLPVYLKHLPKGDGIYKANYAVSNKKGLGKIYFVDEKDIEKFNLPAWIRGCNSLNKKHPTVVTLLKDRELKESLIKSLEIKTITFDDLVKLYDITKIGQLKIDTEGHDHLILPGVIKLIQGGSFKIDKVIFEYLKGFKNTAALDRIIKKFIDLGYSSIQIGDNMTLIK